MSLSDNFDDLPNISKNIESKIQSKNKLSLRKDSDEEKNSTLITQEINITDNITKVEKNLSENQKNLNNSISKIREEISQNFEKFIKKLEDDTNEHINNIENLKLTEEEKKSEYIKCIEQLDNILTINELMKNCIEISEENLLEFITKLTSFNKDPIISYLTEKKDNLNKNIIYNYLNDTQKNSEKIYNNLKSPDIKNYIINSKTRWLKLKKLKINKYCDFQSLKQILCNITNQEKSSPNEIKEISINNLSKRDFEYIFNNIRVNKIKRNPTKLIDNNVFNLNENEKSKRCQSIIMDYDKIRSKILRFSNKESSKVLDSEFIIIDNNNEEEKTNYSKIEFNFPKIYIKNTNLRDIKLNEIFGNINVLKICSCKLSFDFYNIFHNGVFDKMTELYLDNCNIVNENFYEIIFAIIKNNILRNNLKCLSFKKNNLSSLFFYQYILDGKVYENKFENLEMIDLSYNNLNNIDNKSLSGLPNIKVIDLSNNNLQFPQDFYTLYEKYKKLLQKKATKIEDKANQTSTPTDKQEEINKGLLFQIANNIGLLKGNQINTYLKYLIEVLPKLNYPLKSINLSGLFYKSTCHNLISSINLNKFQNSLIELDLSICNITDKEIANLLINEFCIVNIKKMNLSNNKLTDELFSLLIKNKSYDIYNQLKILDLSNNNISLIKKDFKDFVKLFDSLKLIIIKNTPAEQNINNYIKKIIIIFNEIQNNDNNKTALNEIDILIKGLIENKQDKENYLINNNNIKLKMKNTIDYKFIEAAEKIYPDLFERINIEYKKMMPN